MKGVIKVMSKSRDKLWQVQFDTDKPKKVIAEIDKGLQLIHDRIITVQFDGDKPFNIGTRAETVPWIEKRFKERR